MVFLVLLSSSLGAPAVYRPGAYQEAAAGAAAEFAVPEALLHALAYEASRFNPEIVSEWGGYGMFDLRESDQDPSLEHAAALLEVDPNRMAADWRLQVRGAAAILADQARLASPDGALPATDDLLAWWDAARAFSGRQEPVLQDLYATYLFEVLRDGVIEDTRWGRVVIAPHALDLSTYAPVPPPSATDSALAAQYYAACSSNYSDYSRGAGDIDMVVIHTVQGSYSGCYSWFANCSASASAHYVVRSSDGQITQMVREADVAWHAGHWDTNYRSIGIEHEGYVEDPGTWYTSALYTSSAALTADIASRQGVSLSRSYVIGHNEVPGCPYGSGGGASCHTDPGDGWDWDSYMALVNGETGTAGGELVGVVADSDIYNGARLAGASVWIAETGDTTTADSSGTYRFADLPFGHYTVHAAHPGYAEGTCTKDTSSAQDWCSIALYPESSGGTEDDTGTPNDGEDTAAPDTGELPGDPEGAGEDGPLLLPGNLVRADEVGGCASRPGPAPGAALLLAVAGLASAARRRKTVETVQVFAVPQTLCEVCECLADPDGRLVVRYTGSSPWRSIPSCCWPAPPGFRRSRNRRSSGWSTAESCRGGRTASPRAILRWRNRWKSRAPTSTRVRRPIRWAPTTPRSWPGRSRRRSTRSSTTEAAPGSTPTASPCTPPARAAR